MHATGRRRWTLVQSAKTLTRNVLAPSKRFRHTVRLRLMFTLAALGRNHWFSVGGHRAHTPRETRFGVSEPALISETVRA